MKEVLITDAFGVFDDVLNDSDAELLWRHVQLENYSFVHQSRWQKVFRLCDGQPLAGPTAFSGRTSTYGEKGKIYPTHTGIDLFMSVMSANLSVFSKWTGEWGRDWQVFDATPYLYPPGTGLSWHRDIGSRTGSYVFYAHPEWNIQWGGELLISDRHVEAIIPPKYSLYGKSEAMSIPPTLDNTFESNYLMRPGVGQYIAAKPNRLVIIAQGIPHRINNTMASASAKTRCSIAGFFLVPGY